MTKEQLLSYCDKGDVIHDGYKINVTTSYSKYFNDYIISIELKPINLYTESVVHTAYLEFINEDDLGKIEEIFKKEREIMSNQEKAMNKPPLILEQIENIYHSAEASFKDKNNNKYILMTSPNKKYYEFVKFEKEPSHPIKQTIEINGKKIIPKYSFWLSSCVYNKADIDNVLGIENEKLNNTYNPKYFEHISILKSDLSNEKLESIIERYKTFFSSNNLNFYYFENLGKKQLAYKINNYNEGIYLIIKGRGDIDQIRGNEKNFRHDDDVLKFITVQKDEREIFSKEDLMNEIKYANIINSEALAKIVKSMNFDDKELELSLKNIVFDNIETLNKNEVNIVEFSQEKIKEEIIGEIMKFSEEYQIKNNKEEESESL